MKPTPSTSSMVTTSHNNINSSSSSYSTNNDINHYNKNGHKGMSVNVKEINKGFMRKRYMKALIPNLRDLVNGEEYSAAHCIVEKAAMVKMAADLCMIEATMSCGTRWGEALRQRASLITNAIEHCDDNMRNMNRFQTSGFTSTCSDYYSKNHCTITCSDKNVKHMMGCGGGVNDNGDGDDGNDDDDDDDDDDITMSKVMMMMGELRRVIPGGHSSKDGARNGDGAKNGDGARDGDGDEVHYADSDETFLKETAHYILALQMQVDVLHTLSSQPLLTL